jgi:hypothetical protein
MQHGHHIGPGLIGGAVDIALEIERALLVRVYGRPIEMELDDVLLLDDGGAEGCAEGCIDGWILGSELGWALGLHVG